MKNKYTIPEQEPQMVRDESAEYVSEWVIPVRVPTMGGYTMDELIGRLTTFALALVKSETPKRTEKVYSSRLMRLHERSRNNITEQDMQEDGRLAYLINK